MKRSSTLFLKSVLVLIAFVTLAGLLWFPQTEGRAANLDLVSIYKDPLIIYFYIGSIPFFFALFQSFKLLGYIEQNKVFSAIAVKALQNIKFSALTIVGFLIGAMIFIRLNAGNDDPAGALMMGMILSFVSVVVATAAAVFQRLLQSAVDLKSENDLTV